MVFILMFYRYKCYGAIWIRGRSISCQCGQIYLELSWRPTSLCIARGNLSCIRSVVHCLGSWPSKMHVRTTLFFYHCFHLWFILFLCFLAVYVWTEECFKFSQRISRFLIIFVKCTFSLKFGSKLVYVFIYLN